MLAEARKKGAVAVAKVLPAVGRHLIQNPPKKGK